MKMDHLKREFKNEKEMCEHWGVKPNTYYQRRKRGMSKEKALTPVGVYDHLRKWFKNEKEMCDHWKMNYVVYINRKCNLKWSVEKALTTPNKRGTEKKIHKDHLGKEFSSEKKMCDHWDRCVTTYRKRIKCGLSIKDALTFPVKISIRKEIAVDHKGVEYKNVTTMCSHWNIDYAIYRQRRLSGWTLEHALELPVDNRYRDEKITDHTGQTFNNPILMCRHWGRPYRQYYRRVKYQGWSIQKALERP